MDKKLRIVIALLFISVLLSIPAKAGESLTDTEEPSTEEIDDLVTEYPEEEDTLFSEYEIPDETGTDLDTGSESTEIADEYIFEEADSEFPDEIIEEGAENQRSVEDELIEDDEPGSIDDAFLSGETVREGDCGIIENTVFWSVDENGILYITGEGEMEDWESPEEVPWYDYSGEIVGIDIGEDVYTIGSFAFSECYEMKEVRIG